MGNLAGKLLVVALITEFAFILHGFERMLSSRRMAYRTLKD
jgi:hypothetical protein